MAARDIHRNVVILGGGFAGAFSARYLRRVLPRDVSMELICDRNYFVFQPLLPEVAAGTINALVVGRWARPPISRAHPDSPNTA